MVIPMDKHPWRSRQQFGNLLEFSANRASRLGLDRCAPLRLDAVLEEMIELPHQKRHIEASVERETIRIGW